MKVGINTRGCGTNGEKERKIKILPSKKKSISNLLINSHHRLENSLKRHGEKTNNEREGRSE
jgi:hypothetical protein